VSLAVVLECFKYGMVVCGLSDLRHQALVVMISGDVSLKTHDSEISSQKHW